MEPTELVIVVVLCSIIVLGVMANVWYATRNYRGYRDLIIRQREARRAREATEQDPQ